MTITRQSIVVAARDQLTANVTGSETVIAGFRRGNYYALDAVGARVWELVQQPIAADELQRAIVDEYDVTLEQCQSDLFALLEQMEKEGLIEVRS